MYFKCDRCNKETTIDEIKHITILLNDNVLRVGVEEHSLDICNKCFKPSRDIIIIALNEIKN